MNNIDFSNIRPVNGTLNDGFEEFICQLARKEDLEGAVRFVRNGKPDGGVECYWILDDGSLVFWQAKYFLRSFDNAQFQQINDSVNSAFRNYAGIKRYIIAIPIDIPDIHKPGVKSMRDRMDEYVQRWKDTYPNSDFEVWGQSEIVARIQMPKCQGLLRFWFNANEFTDDDFIKQNNTSIADLGIRYTPKNNVKLDLWRYFHALSRDDTFEKYFFDNLKVVELACNTLEKDPRCEKLLESIARCRALFKPLFSLDIQGADTIPFDEIKEFLYDFSGKISEVAEDQINDNSKNDSNSRAYENIYKENVKILNVYNAFNNDLTPLANDPILILEGDAGVGKSHLFADVVTSLSKKKHSSFLFLGQKFTTDEDATRQMLRMANFNGTLEEFLDTLDCQAQANKHRTIIFIDAINEGKGLYLWRWCIRSFIEAVRQHHWLGLALSVRSSYNEAIFPHDEYGFDYCVRAHHYGFGSKFMEAVNLYFRNYGIALPHVPLLSPEFHNPLYLRLFCEGIKKNGYVSIPEASLGFTSIMDIFFDGVEKSLREKKMYPSTLKVLPKAIEIFVNYIVETKRHEMPLENAVSEFRTIFPSIFMEGELVELLIAEGIFAKNIFYDSNNRQWKECIYLSYERIENTIIAKNLLEKYNNEGIKKFLLSEDLRIRHVGILEALAVSLPEIRGIELYELFPNGEFSFLISSCVMKSLLWRKEFTMGKHLEQYFESVISDNRLHSLFFYILFQTCFMPTNRFNGFYLHKHLSSMHLADRDALLIPILYTLYGDYESYLKDLVSWAWKERSMTTISDESILPGVIAMSWLFSSTNRKLRDTAAKGVISLLSNRLHIIVPLLKYFENVDDPYVLERLYAVCLGCVVRSKDVIHIREICLYIYEHIFNVDEVYPHILLRDYARETIEYAISVGVVLSIDINKIRPPYKSTFGYGKVPDRVIKKMMVSDDGNYVDSPGLISIIMSMGTEHSRIHAYGDFGRYTFQSVLKHWQIDPEEMSNIAVMMIIEKFGYDEQKHGSFDSRIGSGRTRSTVPNERIGKKYQWVALHELAARISDNCTMLENPWSDNETHYYGPWNPFVRDFDPTTLGLQEGDDELSPSRYDYWWSQPQYCNWDFDITDWLLETKDLISGEQIIQVTDRDGEDWLILEQYPAWEEPHVEKGVYKRYWNIVRSYIVDETDFDNLYNRLSKFETRRNSLPESREIYQMYYREYYWSPAYLFYDSEYDLESINHHVIELSGNIINIDTTSICYMWEAGTDYSKSTTIRCIMPSKQLFDGMNLHFSDMEGVFLDSNNRVVLFDGAAIEPSPTCLLVKKKPLLDYLKANHKRIFWNVIGEKNIIGLYSYANVPSWLYISGCYKINEDGSVFGSLKTSRKR